mmetsp:Transcript_6533/g.26206  ORF Transcript_6533/g.26206 Transcript_6533/m.26206 type:complete len:206 (+) Transcript_6533:1865-2482(+)
MCSSRFRKTGRTRSNHHLIACTFGGWFILPTKSASFRFSHDNDPSRICAEWTLETMLTRTFFRNKLSSTCFSTSLTTITWSTCRMMLSSRSRLCLTRARYGFVSIECKTSLIRVLSLRALNMSRASRKKPTSTVSNIMGVLPHTLSLTTGEYLSNMCFRAITMISNLQAVSPLNKFSWMPGVFAFTPMERSADAYFNPCSRFSDA